MMFPHALLRKALLVGALLAAPAISFAQFAVGVTVGFAPPALPLYVQPPCPQANYMWTPGYWAWDDPGADYFWVPGAWVEAPQPGYLWTPGYWGWGEGVYLFHTGYWGSQVGFYGGVNYGFGYGGGGFSGGEWRNGVFAYNTAAVSVGPAVRTTYVNTNVVSSTTIVNNNHAAFNGGPGGVKAAPSSQQQAYASQPHFQPTSAQVQHQQVARQDKANFASTNGGVPAHAALDHPATNVGELQHSAVNGIASPGAKTYTPPSAAERSNTNTRPTSAPNYNGNGQTAPRQPQYTPRPQSEPRPESRPAPQQQQQKAPSPPPQNQNQKVPHE